MDTESVDNARKDALSFLRHHKTAVLATVTEGGAPHATMIFYVADDNFNIHFLTRVDTRKFQAIQNNPKVAITIATADIPQSLQIEGTARSIELAGPATSMREALMGMLDINHWFRAPMTKQDPTMVHEMRIEPTWIRWSDYAFEQDGNENVFKEIPVIR